MAANAKQKGIRHDTSKRNRDQIKAHALVTTAGLKYFLAYGGSGGGKSFFWIDVIVERAIRAPGSRHAIFRLTRNSCEKTLFDKTLHEVLDKAWPGLKDQPGFEISHSTMTVTLPNGSKIFFDGLDENRMTKVLGDEFNTILINECNEDGLSYKQVSVLISRLRAKTLTVDGKVLANKFFFDCNPRFYSDWEYKAFIQKINPLDGDALHHADQWVAFKMEAEANKANLHPDYIDSLMAGSSSDRRRYVSGEWSDENTNALFTEAMFVDHRIPKPNDVKSPEATLAMLAEQGIALNRVTVAVDPATKGDTKNDLHGITVQSVAGYGKDAEVYVLADYSRNGSPIHVCDVIAKAYKEWGACRIIIEDNAGGKWLQSTIAQHSPHLQGSLKFVNANKTTGDKSSRAEPVAGMYEIGKVHHVGKHPELELQMCDWGSPASRKKSPDRMDAVVWGITELLDLNQEKKPTMGAWQISNVTLW